MDTGVRSMNERFARGLLVGKFAPLHHGHEFIIRQAMSRCDSLSIISYSNPEFPGCEPTRREQWLEELFPTVERLVLPASEVPPNVAPESLHRDLAAKLCLERLGHTVDAVFTSERDGDGFAQVLAKHFGHPVTHVCVDEERRNVPVSGTTLRADIHGNRQRMSPLVYASFVKRVGILGGESTGKTTLAEALAKQLQTSWAAEYGRELWEKRKGKLIYADMLRIAREQVQREEELAQNAHRFLICDTTPLATLFYCHEMFGQAEPELEELSRRPYDALVICAPDFAFAQDGARREPGFRERQHTWYLTKLRERKVAWLPARGPVDSRVEFLEQILSKLQF
jgi:NadR type nicotinamide-nucleotide adenylyltransferase